jgi:hypothetical protein
MSDRSQQPELHKLIARERSRAFGGLLLAGWTLMTMSWAALATAADQAVRVTDDFRPDPFELHPPAPVLPSTALVPAPRLYTFTAPVPEDKSFPANEFRPRGHSLSETETDAARVADPLVHDSNVWQRLADYRAHDRIRVLTLWESGPGAISLQAGHKGNPSLQWTSHLMNRGGATHGLLDRLLPAPEVAEGGIARPMPRPGSQPPPGKAPAALGVVHFPAPLPPVP